MNVNLGNRRRARREISKDFDRENIKRNNLKGLEGNNLKSFDEFHLENEQARSRLWTWLCDPQSQVQNLDLACLFSR